jgi:hypothetical protein
LNVSKETITLKGRKGPDSGKKEERKVVGGGHERKEKSQREVKHKGSGEEDWPVGLVHCK